MGVATIKRRCRRTGLEGKRQSGEITEQLRNLSDGNPEPTDCVHNVGQHLAVVRFCNVPVGMIVGRIHQNLRNEATESMDHAVLALTLTELRTGACQRV
jgi:hypothetical protein